jgi:fluoride ion exporter CrcB/FEX
MNSSQTQRESAVRTSAESSLPNGPGAAAILAAGIGCFLLSVFAVVADASKPVAKFFTFYVPTGPLSGVTTTAIFLWLVTWFVLARLWRHRSVALAKINIAAFAFSFLGILLTFPPFADLLLRK